MVAEQENTVTSSSDSMRVPATLTWVEYHTMVIMEYEGDGPDSSDWWIDEISRPSSPSGWSAVTVEISSTDADSDDDIDMVEISSTEDEDSEDEVEMVEISSDEDSGDEY